MKNIYIVFDKLHSNEAGGLVSAYASLIQLLKDDYTIKVISIINSNLTRHDMFSDCEIINVSKYDLAMSSIETRPVSFLPSVIGSVTTLSESINFHALRTEISLSIPSVCLISIFITCGRTSLIYSGASTPNLFSTK